MSDKFYLETKTLDFGPSRVKKLFKRLVCVLAGHEWCYVKIVNGTGDGKLHSAVCARCYKRVAL